MSFKVHPGDIVWMVTCDHGFPKPDTIVQLKVVSTGRKYFCCTPVTGRAPHPLGRNGLSGSAAHLRCHVLPVSWPDAPSFL